MASKVDEALDGLEFLLEHSGHLFSMAELGRLQAAAATLRELKKRT